MHSSWTLLLKLKSMLLKVRLMFPSSGPLMASLNAVMDADVWLLVNTFALPLGRGIVSLDCGYKWLPGGLNYSFWMRQKQQMHNQKTFLFYLIYFILSLFLFYFVLTVVYLHRFKHGGISTQTLKNGMKIMSMWLVLSHFHVNKVLLKLTRFDRVILRRCPAASLPISNNSEVRLPVGGPQGASLAHGPGTNPELGC